MDKNVVRMVNRGTQTTNIFLEEFCVYFLRYDVNAKFFFVCVQKNIRSSLKVTNCPKCYKNIIPTSNITFKIYVKKRTYVIIFSDSCFGRKMTYLGLGKCVAAPFT